MILDTVVIGAGVTGLSVAAQLAAGGRSVCIIERRPRPGMETSTHNSGVIHAGLYYPAGTLKAGCASTARRGSMPSAPRTGVPHDRCGKLVVASTPEEVPQIEALAQLGADNGAPGLEIVGRQFIQAREPHVEGLAALWSPATGRVEPEALVRALLQLAEGHDAMLLRGTSLAGGEPNGGGFALRTEHETIRRARGRQRRRPPR